jgi:hypothetical protein
MDIKLPKQPKTMMAKVAEARMCRRDSIARITTINKDEFNGWILENVDWQTDGTA